MSCSFISVCRRRPRGNVYGGRNAHDAPWFAAVRKGCHEHVHCGAIIIHKRWLLSVAHCFYNDSNWPSIPPYPRRQFSVTMGTRDRTSRSARQYKIREIIEHPQFNKRTYENDIALIKLELNIQFSRTISPICIKSESFINSNFVFNSGRRNTNGTVFGYGLTERDRHERFRQHPIYLQKATLQLVDQTRCIDSVRNTGWPVTPQMFCAGNSAVDTADVCNGDSGGPFAAKVGGVWYLLGLSSWGHPDGCDLAGQYSFFTRVSKFSDWIHSKITP